MASENIDFSCEILERRLPRDPQGEEVPQRLHNALAFLCKNHNAKYPRSVNEGQLLSVYIRGYFNNDEGAQSERQQQALARTLLFLKMEQGQTIPYLYKKLDQDLSATTPPIFDDGERGPLRFTKEQLIEAQLLGRRFGIEHYEEELSFYLSACETR